MEEDIVTSELEESLEGPYVLRVDQPVDAEKTFIAPSKISSQPLSDDEEEFSIDSLDFNFTNCGESNGRRSIIGQINPAHNHNLTTIANEYASSSIEESTDAEDSELADQTPEKSTDDFDPFDLLATKQVFNFDDLTPKQAVIAMGKLGTRLETCKTMYPTMIKDNMVANLKSIESNLLGQIQEIEELRCKPPIEIEDEENNLLVKIIQQLEHKLTTLNEHIAAAKK